MNVLTLRFRLALIGIGVGIFFYALTRQRRPERIVLPLTEAGSLPSLAEYTQF